MIIPKLATAKVAVFLDRDGTVVENVEYNNDPDKVSLLPGAAEAVAKLNNAQLSVFIVTNQSGIARGIVTFEELAAVHKRLDELFATKGAHIDAYYFCPHHPTEGNGPLTIKCFCRKPSPGLLKEAASEHGVDLRRSYFIGDHSTDIEAGKAVGMGTVLVRTGYGKEIEAKLSGDKAPDFVADSLLQAIEYVIEDMFG
jgi:D-glycero-D-manno-heptose 1,7-bisphosphate phosphatase